MTTKRKRGRPAFVATTALRRRVEELVSCGMSAEDIARAIGCHSDTVAKHFEEELRTGHAKRRAEVIELLYRTARKGNVSAQKRLDEMTAAAATTRENARRPAEAASLAKPKALGKKEEQAVAAQNPDVSTPLGELMARRMGQNRPH